MSKYSKIIFLMLSINGISGCSSSGRIVLVSDLLEIPNIPIEIIQNIFGVEDVATKKAKQEVKESKKKNEVLQKENEALQQSLKEKEQMLSYIQENIKCMRVEREGNNILFLPDPECYQ